MRPPAMYSGAPTAPQFRKGPYARQQMNHAVISKLTLPVDRYNSMPSTAPTTSGSPPRFGTQPRTPTSSAGATPKQNPLAGSSPPYYYNNSAYRQTSGISRTVEAQQVPSRNIQFAKTMTTKPYLPVAPAPIAPAITSLGSPAEQQRRLADVNSGPIGFSAESLPSPCAVIRLPCGEDFPNSSMLQLIPTNFPKEKQEDKRKQNPAKLIIKRTAIEKLAESPSVYLLRYAHIPALIRHSGKESGSNKSTSSNEPTQQPNGVGFNYLFRYATTLFHSSHTIGLGFHTRDRWGVSKITTLSQQKCNVVYCRMGINELPVGYADLQTQMLYFRHQLDLSTHTVVVYDFRFDQTIPTAEDRNQRERRLVPSTVESWHVDYMRKIVHLTAVTQSILSSWLIGAIEGCSLQIIHLPPHAFAEIVDIALATRNNPREPIAPPNELEDSGDEAELPRQPLPDKTREAPSPSPSDAGQKRSSPWAWLTNLGRGSVQEAPKEKEVLALTERPDGSLSFSVEESMDATGRRNEGFQSAKKLTNLRQSPIRG